MAPSFRPKLRFLDYGLKRFHYRVFAWGDKWDGYTLPGTVAPSGEVVPGDSCNTIALTRLDGDAGPVVPTLLPRGGRPKGTATKAGSLWQTPWFLLTLSFLPPYSTP